jgi:hypothetical protein|tara:strand:- start:231 stop:1313 length:1083 start_codon:yes stop_codon:yes gene_type:complete
MTSTSNNNIELTQELKERIEYALIQVTTQQHSNPNKQSLKSMHGRITLACPYCGDSHKDDTAKRGNVFWDTLQYHCYNCGHHTNLHTFLKDHDIRLSKSGDSFAVIDYIQQNKLQVRADNVLKPTLFEDVQKHAIDIDLFKSKFKAKSIEPGEWIWFQLKDRLLHKKLDEFLYSAKEHRLWILNLSTDNKIIGAQTRRMKGYGQRYLSYDLPKLYEEMGQPLQVGEAESNQLAKISTLFGIMRVSFQRPVTLFEGPLDAKFMSNSLALATAGRSTEEFDEIETVRYMFDNDDTGKKKMIEKLKKGRPVFMWSKFLKDSNLDTYNIKDLNDLMIKCFELKSDAFKNINNYFTSSQLDLWYI